PTGALPAALAAGDFNGDGRLDLAAANFGGADVTALLGTGTGDFVPPVLAPSPVRSTPLVAYLTSDKAADAVVLTQTGRILLRRGLAGQPGAFGPPVVLNPDPQLKARDLTLFARGGGGPALAALDAGTFQTSGGPSAPRVPRV